MTAYFGNTTDPANTLNRTVTGMAQAINCVVKQPISIESPYLIVDADSIDLDNNYCQITEYGRSYFITNKEELPGHRVGLQCAVDPLESFKTQILACDCVCARNENEKQSLLMDESYVTSSQDTVWFKNFSGEYTRATNGGRRWILLMG